MPKILIVVGASILIVGLILYLFPDRLGWFGNLPGDIRIKSGNTSFYAPLASMIIVSIILNILIWVIRKLF